MNGVLTHQIADVSEALFSSIVLLVYMLVMDWRLTGILMLSNVLPLGTMGVIGWYEEKKTREMLELKARMGHVAEEQLAGVRTVKSLGHEETAKRRYGAAALLVYSLRRQMTFVVGTLEG